MGPLWGNEILVGWKVGEGGPRPGVRGAVTYISVTIATNVKKNLLSNFSNIRLSLNKLPQLSPNYLQSKQHFP